MLLYAGLGALAIGGVTGLVVEQVENNPRADLWGLFFLILFGLMAVVIGVLLIAIYIWFDDIDAIFGPAFHWFGETIRGYR